MVMMTSASTVIPVRSSMATVNKGPPRCQAKTGIASAPPTPLLVKLRPSSPILRLSPRITLYSACGVRMAQTFTTRATLDLTKPASSVIPQGMSKMKANLSRTLLTTIVESLRNVDEWSVLDEGLQALENNAEWLGLDVSLISGHVAQFKKGVAQVNGARHLRADPSVEEKREQLQSLLPKLDSQETQVAATAQNWRTASAGRQGAADRLVEIDSEIQRLQVERAIVHLNFTKFSNQETRLQSSVEQQEVEHNATRAQVAELRQFLENIPDPTQVLAEAEAVQKAAQKSAIELLELCLKNLNA